MAEAKRTVNRTTSKLKEENEKLKQILETGTRCQICGKYKAADKFYMNTDPMCASTITCVCKECSKKIALKVDDKGNEHEPDKESVRIALRYLDKPFLNKVWDAAIQESENLSSGKIRSNVWAAYAHIIAMSNYVGMTYEQSDDEEKQIETTSKEDNQENDMSEDVKETFLANKKTTLRFLGYDPFENEPAAEQPILYAKLVNYFDESVKDDGLKLEAVIEIVQSFKDVKTINDAISKYKAQLSNNPGIIATIKSLAETKQKMITSALALAKDNGISVNYNNNKSKGAGTLSGIIKELSEMNLEEASINTFDAETNEAISSIMERNFSNQMKQINPDENDWEREVSHQAQLIHTLQKERDNAVEYCRLLRKENKDLKDFLQERGIIDDALQVIDE